MVWFKLSEQLSVLLLLESYLLLWQPLSASIKMTSFVVQLAQDHIVLEEKLVSHAKSAVGNRTVKLGLSSRWT